MSNATTTVDDDSLGVIISWTPILVTLIVSILQGILFYVFFVYQRHKEIVRKKSYDLYEPRQYKHANLSPPPYHDKSTTKWWYDAYHVPDEVFLRCCGLDTFMYLRLLRFGVRICALGSVLAIILIPIYATDSRGSLEPSMQQFNSWTLARVQQSSSRLWATLLAWLLFVNFILLELRYEWKIYSEYYLQYYNPSNNYSDDDDNEAMNDNNNLNNEEYIVPYTVRMEGIPMDYRTNDSMLYNYMNNIFSHGQINSVTMMISCNGIVDSIQKLIQQRQKCILKLESLNAYHHCNPDKIPKKVSMFNNTNATEYYTKEINRINQEIDAQRDIIYKYQQEQQQRQLTTHDSDDCAKQEQEQQRSENKRRVGSNLTSNKNKNNDNDDVSLSVEVVLDDDHKKKGDAIATDTMIGKSIDVDDNDTIVLYSSTAFVTFSSMVSKSMAIQCDLNGDPDSMIVLSTGCNPKSMLWDNINVTLQQQRFRTLIATIVMLSGILFWAVPVSFVVSISNLNSILESLGVDSVNPNLFWYGLVAGLLPVVALAILMIVLYIAIEACGKFYIRYKSYPELDTYVLYWHQLFQFANLWLILIGGSLFSQIEPLFDEPKPMKVIEVIAKALPGASPFFMNMIIISSFGAFGSQLSMLPTYAVKLILSLIQPIEMKTQRQLDGSKTPPSITWGKQIPPIIFIFMVAIMYMPIVPIIDIFALIYFSGMYIVWKHQCLHVYYQNPCNESGGVVTFQMVYNFLLICLYMAEFVFIAYMGMKFAPAQALIGIIPVVTTYLFHIELKGSIIIPLQQLPLETAREYDDKMKNQHGQQPKQEQPMKSGTTIRDDSSIYRQPALDANQDERGPMPYRRDSEISEVYDVNNDDDNCKMGNIDSKTNDNNDNNSDSRDALNIALGDVVPPSPSHGGSVPKVKRTDLASSPYNRLNSDDEC